MYRLIDYGAMLRDRRRVAAYTRALSAVITPSSVVLDVGTGIGTFSILAARLGAQRVYAIERSDVIAVAEEHARANGVADRIRFLHGTAADIEVPERVDVIVSDLSGALPLFEEHLTTIISVRDRFLKPGGAMIPQRDRLFCAPVSNEALYARIVEPWRSIDGVDLSAGETMALNTPQAHAIRPEDLASEPQCWATLDYATLASPHVRGPAAFTVGSDLSIHGFALWFESTLHGDIVHGSGPWSPESVHATMLLPLLRPLALARGQTFHFACEAVLAAGRYVVTWSAGAQRQSSFLSEPRSTSSLQDREATSMTDSAPLPERLEISEQVLSRRVGPELLLLDQATGIYHVLNETGAHVWESLQRGEPLDAIAETVASGYAIDVERATADVAAIVSQLRQANLVRG
ncbi:MAG TPA: PqqD family peptide modification chaperone [Thermoanaerobaculia bacterium]